MDSISIFAALSVWHRESLPPAMMDEDLRILHDYQRRHQHPPTRPFRDTLRRAFRRLSAR
jgi:hypothetical protein